MVELGDKGLAAEPYPVAFAWRGWLRSAVLTVPEAVGAPEYYAELLGGEANEGRVALGSSTELVVEEGPLGVRSAAIDLAGGLPDIDLDANGYANDPDGRRFKFCSAASAQESLVPERPRLGHLTFETPDPIAQQSFFESVGFRLSEGLGTDFRWLRCNPVHHTLAFSRAPRPGVHHVGIELPDRTALIDACDHVSRLGHSIQYGPGRHLVGGNIFAYFLDRYGIRFELFCELERIDDPERQPLIRENVDRSQSVNVWGPLPPESYRQGI